MNNLLIKKLQSFKERIQASPKLNESLKRIIGVELYDFIQANPILQAEFWRRTDYFQNLSKSTECHALVQEIIDLIASVLQLTSLTVVKEKEKEWDRLLLNKLKVGHRGDDVTLSYAYLALQKQNVNILKLLRK